MKRATILALLSFSLMACGGGGGDAPDAAPTSCADYCAEIATNCDATHTQYTSPEVCMNVCSFFEQGDQGTMSGNNLECRAYHAGAALGDPDTHCTHAGPGGDDACGSNCEGFCTIVLNACTGANEAYASMAECMTACGNFDASEPFDSSDQSGDTLACRTYHASVATVDPGFHCPHTQPVSAVCN